jgi:hypothetical protein
MSADDPGLVANSHCEMCGDSGVVQVQRIEYVTRDMAMDAGFPEMEGQPVPQGFENVPCPACFPEQKWTLPQADGE